MVVLVKDAFHTEVELQIGKLLTEVIPAIHAGTYDRLIPLRRYHSPLPVNYYLCWLFADSEGVSSVPAHGPVWRWLHIPRSLEFCRRISSPAALRKNWVTIAFKILYIYTAN
ncbi:hypothetical protein AWV77_00965 [Pseudomonas palleroniana]|uniref:Uncharacterized protein n=1 Tax=Pseudomonas palleroniana TaxID=191390 RepID=A0A120EAI9_9PSED|nr:hypothetical protein AWV77_00965 [Pseudomonas palleroniana]